MPESGYLVAEATNMTTGAKSYKIYYRDNKVIRAAVASGLATREEAEAKLRELELAQESKP